MLRTSARARRSVRAPLLASLIRGLYLFDPQYIGSPENIGLNYSVQITGATPTN
jgi:hypothetical protein